MATPVARRSDRGATAVEYALLVALIAGVIIGVVILLGDSVFGLFTLTNDSNW
ncbi:Flp family type IVb pilin [Nocardioides sp. WS12]|uniref:Flp family type IVb pilin n=1 Tax=Nocardioides sp. WS12 TaxID=2486272 RepID=UPI001F439174|nr:Flp family type IVb pilin [Nocardioides sp. WS12]